MPQPLKDFIESTEKEFENFVSINELYLRGTPVGKIKALFDEKTTQAYELGQATALAMVMREIEEIIKNNPLGERSIVIEEVFSTLKQKLSGNGE